MDLDALAAFTPAQAIPSIHIAFLYHVVGITKVVPVVALLELFQLPALLLLSGLLIWRGLLPEVSFAPVERIAPVLAGDHCRRTVDALGDEKTGTKVHLCSLFPPQCPSPFFNNSGNFA